MKEESLKRIKKTLIRDRKAAEGEQCSPGGFHFGDYRPRYQEVFDIYEKAKNHVREQKKKNSKKDEKSS